MQDYQKQIIKDKEEIDKKIIRMTSFIFSDKFSNVANAEKERIKDQLNIMMEYSHCLRDRIRAFECVTFCEV